jgi:hypothetical protein
MTLRNIFVVARTHAPASFIRFVCLKHGGRFENLQFSSDLRGNLMRIRDKDQPVNGVQGGNLCLFCGKSLKQVNNAYTVEHADFFCVKAGDTYVLCRKHLLRLCQQILTWVVTYDSRSY